jgi:CBS domain containing-hemolysin-like protein
MIFWTLFGIACAALASLFFSTITHALRDFSRSRLEDALGSHKRTQWLESTIENRTDLIFVTAIGLLLANMAMLLLPLRLFYAPGRQVWVQYTAGIAVAGVLGALFSVAIPMALSHYAGESMIAMSVQFLHGLRIALSPATRLMHAIDSLVRRLTGGSSEPEPDQIEKDILSVVEEGEKEGVVDEQEREMIESVIEFRDTQAGQTMTPRPEIVAIGLGAPLEEVKRTIEESGHSRIPVYDGTLDHIVGILYARDLLGHLGLPPEQFDMRNAIRPAIFVPETKPLRDLLKEFRDRKVHLAIVLDEYGGTAGLVTIEDILEELVGEISDEHEPHEPASFTRLSPTAFEADARLYIDEANRLFGLKLPEDAGYDTLGGYVSTQVGHIPQKGTMFEQTGLRFTVLDAEPQRVKRVKVEVLGPAAETQRK